MPKILQYICKEKKNIALTNSKQIKHVFIKKCRKVSQKILARKPDYWIETNSIARAKKQLRGQ